MKTRIDRFMEKVDKGTESNSCWTWRGSISGSGYGQFWNGSRVIPAHWFLVADFIPPGKEACHHCDNKLCVNPGHIFIGTRSDNMRDMVSKGRHNPKAKAEACRKMLSVRKIQRGINNHECRLTTEQAMIAKASPRKYGCAKILADAFGVSSTVICDIRDNKRWTHLPQPDSTARQRAEAFLKTVGKWKEAQGE